MSEALPETGNVDALLSEVAALDMALLRHVNAQALAATDPAVLNGLVRSQQRLARSVRTTLVTHARLRREAAGPGEGTGRGPRPMPGAGQDEPAGPHPDHDAVEAAIEARVRLEYDPAEAEEIDPDIGLFAERACRDGTLASIEERVDAALDAIRMSFGPPGAVIPREARMRAVYAQLRETYALPRPPPDG